MMKKVLICTFHFNIKESIGSIRLRGLAKYLPEYGWDPTILTPRLQSLADANTQYNIIQTQYDDIITIWKNRIGIHNQNTIKAQLGIPVNKNKNDFIDYILKIWEETFAYPDTNIGWLDYAIKAGLGILKKEKYNIILSSSYPPTCHLIAKKLKDKTGIPWIADYRDLWTQNHYLNHFMIRKIFERKLELNTLATADAITTISEPLHDMLRSFHHNKNVYTIMNGFEPEQLNTGSTLVSKLVFTYTGELYRGKRDPEPFFKALSELNKSGEIDIKNVVVKFYGTKDDWLINDIRKYKLENNVTVNGMISREESISEQRKAQILLLITWNHPSESGVYTGKIFDYLAAQRPILSIGPAGGVIEELLKETKAGIHVSDVDSLKLAILKYYQEYKICGQVSYKGDREKIDKYNHRKMAKKFAEVFDSVIVGRINNN
jgi:glycosyltransferase involved in cell wall biosynthesis